MYFIKVDDDTKIAVEDINKNSLKVVVLIHGWPLSKEIFEYQKNELLNKGYRVVSYDIRGFGDSEVSENGVYDFDRLATDLWCVIDNLKVETVNILGFSMGGAIATRYMDLYDNYKVNKIILAGASIPSFIKSSENPYGNDLDSINNLVNLVEINRPKAIRQFIDLLFYQYHTKETITWITDICLKTSGSGAIRSLISLKDESSYDNMSKIKVPTAIFHGVYDKVCFYNNTKLMNEKIDNSIIVPFEESGHALFLDETKKFNQLMIEFFES